MENKNLSDQILRLSNEYFDENFSQTPFIPYVSNVPVSGKVLDKEDLEYLIKSSRSLANKWYFY